MKIDSRFPFRNGSRLKDLPPVLLCVVHGASGSSSAPAPNACRQPAGGHPGSTQRVQRLRRYSVAGIGRRDGVAARASGFCGRAASPFGIACTWRGRPPWDSVAALPVSSGPSPADVAVAVCSSGIAFFLCRGRKKREEASFYNIIRIFFQPGASLDSRLRYAKNIRYYVNNTPLLLRQRSLRSSELP